MIVSRCSYCHQGVQYSDNFKIPRWNVDPEVCFKCTSCKKSAALSFYSGSTECVNGDIYIKDKNFKEFQNQQKGGQLEMAKKDKVDKNEVVEKLTTAQQWKERKEELSRKLIIYAKQMCAGESNEKIRSVISGAYVLFNEELKNCK